MVEVDGPVLHLHHRVLRVVEVGGLVQHLPDAADAGHGHGDHDHHHGQHHQAHEQGHDVAVQAGQVGGGQGAVHHDEVGAQPGHHDDAEVHGDHHGRAVEGQQALGLDRQVVQIPGGLGEFLVLKALPDEGLHHPDGGYVLLNAGVQVVVLAEHLAEDAQGDHHDGADDHHQEGQGDEEGEAQLHVDVHAHGEAEDQGQGRAHRDADDHHKGLLHIGDVGGHAGDQAGHAELVDVGKGKGLNVGVNGLPQVGGQAGGGAGGKAAGGGAEDQAEQGHDHQNGAVAVHRGQVAGLQALSDQPGGDKGQQDLHDDLQRGQTHAQEGVLLVDSQLLQHSFHDLDTSLL